MYQETIGGKPERVQKIPAPKIQKPDTNEELMSQANRAIENYRNGATGVGARHALGRGLPPDHEVFQ